MKKILKTTLPAVLIASTFSSHAQVLGSDISIGGVGSVVKKPFSKKSDNLDQITQLITNLGLYMGYDLSKKPSDEVSDQLIDYSNTGINEMYSYISLMGAVPVDVISTNKGNPYQDYFYFVPDSSPLASSLNLYWNYAFRNPPYNVASDRENGDVVASPLMDQPTSNSTYMQDPVSQGLLNLLATPDDSLCMDWQMENYTKGCNILTQSKVMANIIGKFPGGELFSYDYNKYFMSQLNANNLVAPLLYSTETKDIDQNDGKGYGGLQANSQAQLADNFIRYSAGLVTPIKLIDKKSYSDLFQNADINNKGNVDFNTKMSARSTLAKYFVKLRSYAARYSVGLSNIYYIMSKRMPQNFSGDTSTPPTSQALEEFKMASWRLYKLNSDGSSSGEKSTQWLDKINNASQATVQKEIAVLLSELNYQVYLSRQQQERILLTNSLNMLLANLASVPMMDSTNMSGTQ
jgi:intracellular multiplication protein IcmX